MRSSLPFAFAALLFFGGIPAWATPADPAASMDTPAADAPPDAGTPAPAVSALGNTTVEAISPADAVAPRSASDEEFLLRVRTMEEQVTDFKEKVFRTKARLLLLQESILGGNAAGQGSRALIYHRNEMGGAFMLESVAYALDGAPIFTKVDDKGDLEKQEEIEIFSGRLVPGQHQIAVQLQFRGSGFGVFKYLEGYKFKVQSSYTFDAEPGRALKLKVIAFEQGNFTTELKDRPTVRYEIDVTDETAQPPKPPPAE